MEKEHWDVSKISWYTGPKSLFGRAVLVLQVVFLLFGFLARPQWWNLSADGLADVANAIGLAGALFVWIVNLAPGRHCTVPMPMLYKWAYPHFRDIFFFTMGLLFLCVYEGGLVAGNDFRATYFFIGGCVGCFYILKMCWTFVFDTTGLKNITHSYIIGKINDPGEQRRSLGPLWRRHLLQDCYDCLEGRQYQNLEDILNYSLVWDAQLIPSYFQGPAAQANEEAHPDVVAQRIQFLRKQLSVWDDILCDRSFSEGASLLLLDVERLRRELRGEFMPNFQLHEHKKDKPADADQENYTDVNLGPGRAAWFLTLLRLPGDHVSLFNQVYRRARSVLEGPANSLAATDRMFHHMLLTAHFYDSIDQAVCRRENKGYTERFNQRSSMWDQLSEALVLTEEDFDRLFTLAAQLYAADNSWTLKRYFSQLPVLRKVSFSVESSLAAKTIVPQLTFQKSA